MNTIKKFNKNDVSISLIFDFLSMHDEGILSQLITYLNPLAYILNNIYSGYAATSLKESARPKNSWESTIYCPTQHNSRSARYGKCCGG
jgi:hypothetical protein